MTFTGVQHPRFLNYHEGLVAMKRYLAELFPGEIDFTEDWANDYLSYKRARLAFYNFDYSEARKQLSNLRKTGPVEQRSIRFASNKILFYLACISKRIKFKYDRLVSNI
jgi:hypothetical protein